MRLRNAFIRPARRRKDLGRTLHFERLVWTFVVELLNEGIKLGLLLQQIGAR